MRWLPYSTTNFYVFRIDMLQSSVEVYINTAHHGWKKTSSNWPISAMPFTKYFYVSDRKNYLTYKIVWKGVTEAVRRAKREFFITGTRAGSYHFWHHVKQCTSLGRVKVSRTLWPCHSTTAAKLSANRENNKFIEILHQIIGKRAPTTGAHATPAVGLNNIPQFSLRHVSANDIRRTVDSLPANSFVRADNISIEILKKFPAALLYHALDYF